MCRRNGQKRPQERVHDGPLHPMLLHNTITKIQSSNMPLTKGIDHMKTMHMQKPKSAKTQRRDYYLEPTLNYRLQLQILDLTGSIKLLQKLRRDLLAQQRRNNVRKK